MKNKLQLSVCSLILFICMLCSATDLHAQSLPTPSTPRANWLELYNDNNIVVYYHTGNCTGSDAIYLRFENKTENNLSISWSLWDLNESKKIDLASKSTRTGECSSAGDFKLIDFIPPGQSASTILSKFVVTENLK